MPPHAKDGPRVHKSVRLSKGERRNFEVIQERLGLKTLDDAIRESGRFMKNVLDMVETKHTDKNE